MFKRDTSIPLFLVDQTEIQYQNVWYKVDRNDERNGPMAVKISVTTSYGKRPSTILLWSQITHKTPFILSRYVRKNLTTSSKKKCELS